MTIYFVLILALDASVNFAKDCNNLNHDILTMKVDEEVILEFQAK